MAKVAVNPPKTPVTAASSGISAATTPNVCKMPGPPAPFIPSPLPNVGKSGDSPGDYTCSVLMEGAKCAVRGSFFKSMGDMASKGTGGGLVSQTTHGKTEFVDPGSMNVLAEGSNVEQLGACMTNNGEACSNGGMTPKEAQAPGSPDTLNLNTDCNEQRNGKDRWDSCQKEEFCAMAKAFNEVPKEDIEPIRPSPGSAESDQFGDYVKSLGAFEDHFAGLVAKPPSPENEAEIRKQFYTDCRYEAWKKGNPEGKPPPPVPPRAPRPPRSSKTGGALAMNPDHVHDAGLGGSLEDLDNCRWVSSKVNKSLGKSLGAAATSGRYQPGMKVALPNCNCP